MASTKFLKKDLLLLAKKHGLKATTRMTREQILELFGASARKQAVFELAQAMGFKPVTRMTKQQLLDLCLPQAPARVSSGTMPQKREEPAAFAGNAPLWPEPRAKMPAEPDVELPWRYNENRLVIMPVNPYKVYGYWELTDKAEHNGRQYEIKDCRLALNLYAIAENGDYYVVQTVEIGPFGEYYFNRNMAGQIVWLEIEIKPRAEAESVPVLYSLKMQMPTDHVSDSTEELYLTIMDNYADKRTLVFSGNSTGAKSPSEILLTDFESFPKFGY